MDAPTANASSLSRTRAARPRRLGVVSFSSCWRVYLAQHPPRSSPRDPSRDRGHPVRSDRAHPHPERPPHGGQSLRRTRRRRPPANPTRNPRPPRRASPEPDFAHLKASLGTTDGNLGRHLQVLERAGLIDQVKEPKGSDSAPGYRSHPKAGTPSNERSPPSKPSSPTSKRNDQQRKTTPHPEAKPEAA